MYSVVVASFEQNVKSLNVIPFLGVGSGIPPSPSLFTLNFCQGKPWLCGQISQWGFMGNDFNAWRRSTDVTYAWLMALWSGNSFSNADTTESTGLKGHSANTFLQS